jgi:hypothetical protein
MPAIGTTWLPAYSEPIIPKNRRSPMSNMAPSRQIETAASVPGSASHIA